MKFCCYTSFTFLNNPNDLDPSYKMDLDFWDCFEGKKILSYNQKNMVSKETVAYPMEEYHNTEYDSSP